jgi:DNA-binding winged helix-turn-helix (wHTH) protein/Tol biopolymer transport system component
MSNKMFYDFEGFRVDTEQNCLWRGEELISLTPKAFQTLVVLIKNQGKVMSKNSLLDEVWKDTFVEESTLAQNISTLRKTLAKYDKSKEFIATVPRLGYRFVADVTEILADEEILVVERHSVTHIVAEQEQIDDREETAISRQTNVAPVPRPASFSKTLLFGIPLAILTVLAIGFIAVNYFSNSSNFYNSKFQKYRVNNLLSGGNINGVTASPDAKYIAVIEQKTEGDAILLKQIEDGNTLEVLPKSDLIITGITFSPKSDYLYYSAYKKQDTLPKVGKLYKIPILGGASQEVLKDIDSPVAISDDGKNFAFIRNKLEAKQNALIISDADGSNEKELLVRELQNGFSTYGLSFSPDGKLISTVINDRDDEKLPTKVIVVNTENGEQKPLTTQNWLWIGKTSWLKDGSGIALVAYGSKSPNLTDEIWFISYPEGEAKVITNGVKGVNGISITDDLNSIVATKQNRIAGSYVGSIDDLENATEISKTAEAEELLQLGTDWTADGKIVYSKTNNGNADIWIMNSDGTKSRQLTSDDSADFVPKVSADERFIFFLSNRSGAMSIWRMDLSGGNQTEIVKGKSFFAPSVSEKNDYIYYSAKSKDKPHNVLWRADFDGKNAKEVTSVRTFFAKVSPDGKYVFCFYPDAEKDPEDLTQPLKLTILSAQDGKIIRQFASLKRRAFPKIEWQQDSKAFLILEKVNDKTTLSVQPIDGGEAKILKDWKTENVYQIALSKDGEKLFYEKGEEVTSIIQLKDLKPSAE